MRPNANVSGCQGACFQPISAITSNIEIGFDDVCPAVLREASHSRATVTVSARMPAHVGETSPQFAVNQLIRASIGDTQPARMVCAAALCERPAHRNAF